MLEVLARISHVSYALPELLRFLPVPEQRVDIPQHLVDLFRRRVLREPERRNRRRQGLTPRIELLGRAVLAFLRALELIFQPPDLALRFVALLPLTLDLRDHLLAAIQESRKRLLSADRALSHILQLPAQFTAIRVDPLLQRVCSPSRPPTG